MQARRPAKPTVFLAALLAIAAAPLAAPAQPPGAAWSGDICHQPQRAGQGAVQCLAYPPRIETHEHNCRWVQDAYGGATHQFEVCRGPDGVWRPNGRS
jgi:hypothetical protein